MKLISILTILILLTGCAITGNTVKEDTIKIGFISPLTGSASTYGVPALNGVTLALEDINREGINGKQLELIVENGECNAKTAVTAANKLIYQDNVQIILGGHCSPESLAIAPIAEENKVVLFASATSNPDYTFTGDYTFRNTPVNTEGIVLAQSLPKLGINRVAVIVEMTNYAIPIRDAFVENFPGEVVAIEEFSEEPSDFRTQITKIKAQNPDAVLILPQAVRPAVNIIKQMKEMGLDVQIIGNNVYDTPELHDSLGESAEGIIISNMPLIDETNPEVVVFKEKYMERHGMDVPVLAHTLDAVAAAYLIADALEVCGEETACIKDYLYGLENEPTLSGLLTIDENGDANRPFILMKFENGKMVKFDP